MSNHKKRSIWTKIFYIAGGIASILTVLGVLLSVFFYIKDRPDRTRDTINTAWQIVASMEGKKGSGGRESAIKQLRTHGEDLSGIVLDNSMLKRLQFIDTKLSNASFINAKLEDVKFDKSKIYETSFQNAELREAQFYNAILNDIDFIGAVVTDANFEQACIKRCYGDSSTYFNGSVFRNASISYSEFRKTNFNNTQFDKSNLVEVVLNDCYMYRSCLNEANWSHVEGHSLRLLLAEANGFKVVAGSNLTEAYFDCSKLISAKFENAILNNASFFNSDLTNAIFVDSDLTDADFSSAIFGGTKFIRCKIKGLKLPVTDISGLDIINCQKDPNGLLVNERFN